MASRVLPLDGNFTEGPAGLVWSKHTARSPVKPAFTLDFCDTKQKTGVMPVSIALVPSERLELPCLSALPPQGSVSTNSTTRAWLEKPYSGTSGFLGSVSAGAASGAADGTIVTFGAAGRCVSTTLSAALRPCTM
jgi:hypothetical protein